jgi:large repetitive protein
MKPSFDPFAFNLTGNSTLYEDVEGSIGRDFMWSCYRVGCMETVAMVSITGFPQNAILIYLDDMGNNITIIVGPGGATLKFNGTSEALLRTRLNSLRIIPPPQSDTDFSLTVNVTDSLMVGNDNSTYMHLVKILAIADLPSVAATPNITMLEEANVTLNIFANHSIDRDNSETLSVKVRVPSDALGPVGSLSPAFAVPNVFFTVSTNGTYIVTATGVDAATREASLDAFLENGGIVFSPRPQFSGSLSGAMGILVEAISTENANGADLAPGNNALAMTIGDFDTKIEVASTYIDLEVRPVVDPPMQAMVNATVQENSNSSSVTDPDLVVNIGQILNLTVIDIDGSESFNLTLTGFPTTAQNLSFATARPGVFTTKNMATGTVTISGANVVDVLAVLQSLFVTLNNDDDTNFVVNGSGFAMDTNGGVTVSAPFTLSSTSVTVQAVADSPIVTVGVAVKPAVTENSTFVTYPVQVDLGDTDGSETIQSVVVSYSTAGAGNMTNVVFGNLNGATLTTMAGSVTLTGSLASIQAALMTLMIKPGDRNGEDITVVVTATSVESNPTEPNNMGPGMVGNEISVPTAITVATFVIPVNPLIIMPTLSLTNTLVNFTEDMMGSFGTISVFTEGVVDPDGSETYFFEIEESTIPPGTVFMSGGVAVGTNVAGWRRIPSSAFGSLTIDSPPNFSGSYTLNVRGFIQDASVTDTVTGTTSVQTILITVLPDADGIVPAPPSEGVEDNGTVAFGAVLANATTGIRVVDDGTPVGSNNNATETISRIQIVVPADTATLTYTLSGTYVSPTSTPISGVGTAMVSFNTTTRTYTITSTIITGASNLGLLTPAQQASAEQDIRGTLATFLVQIGPMHIDTNGAVSVIVSTLDVNIGKASTLVNAAFIHTVRIQAVADTPSIETSPTIFVAEDMANIPLILNATGSADTDGSETLSVKITVPQDALGPVGTLAGTGSNIVLSQTSSGVYLITSTSATPAQRQTDLSNFFMMGNLVFIPRTNWSGKLNGTMGLKVDAISTEMQTSVGVELAPGSFGGPDMTSQTETATDYINIDVRPSVDVPIVKGNAVGPEDTNITIPISVTLADTDGSESYVMKITGGVPLGAILYGSGGRQIPLNGTTGFYDLTPADIQSLKILPPLHSSSPVQGDIVLVTTTTVTDTNGDVAVSASFQYNITIAVVGIADKPGSASAVVLADEDAQIRLGVAIYANIGTLSSLLVDVDSSETPYLILSNVPAGLIPTSNVTGGISFLGGGRWQVSEAALPGLELPPKKDFSGENLYSGIKYAVTAQEIDGDQATSDLWTIVINVRPVIAGANTDGFASWNLGVTTSEGALETPGPRMWLTIHLTCRTLLPMQKFNIDWTTCS